MIFLKYCRVKEKDLHSLTAVEGEAAGLEALQEDDNSPWFSYITFCCARKFDLAWIFNGNIANQMVIIGRTSMDRRCSNL